MLWQPIRKYVYLESTWQRWHGWGWAGGRTPFLKPSFLHGIIQRETLSSSLPAWCHPFSKGNSIALGSWWFMGWVARGRLLFLLQLVFINDQQPAGWGQKQQALCLILLTQALSAASSRPAEGRWPRGQMKNLDHSELRVPVIKVGLLHKASLSASHPQPHLVSATVLGGRHCHPCFTDEMLKLGGSSSSRA